MKPLEPATNIGDYVRTIENIRETLTEIHLANQQDLPMWVVYGPGTSDYPGLHVMRMFISRPSGMITVEPTNVLVRAVSLEQIRDLVPLGLHCLARNPHDDANIIETWF
jgi:hypothetical protein